MCLAAACLAESACWWAEPTLLIAVAVAPPQAQDKPRLELAERALELEKQGRYREALDLLQQLEDADFIIPQHREIKGELDGGRFEVEWVGPFYIGNRRVAMMRCHLRMGNPREAVALAWQTLEAGTADPSAFACIAEHPDLQGGFDQVESRLRDLLKKNPKDRGSRYGLDYVQVERDLAEGKYAPVVARIRSGAWLRSTERGPDAELKEYVAAALARRAKEALPEIVKTLDPKGQPTWIVYCLGLCGDERAIEPLFDYLLAVENTWAREETVLALSRCGDKAASFAVAKLESDKPVVRERAAEVLSSSPGDALQKADPGLKHILQALRDPRNRGTDGWVNIPTFLLRAVAATRTRQYIGEVRRIKEEVRSFGTFGDGQYIYTLGYLGDLSVVPELIAGLDATYGHFARPALEAATGKSFSTKRQWEEWWQAARQKPDQ
jgi:tetratricopeptide (TPR) repeat protein